MAAYPERNTFPEPLKRHLQVASAIIRHTTEGSLRSNLETLRRINEGYSRLERGMRERFIQYANGQPRPGSLDDRKKHLSAIAIDFLHIATDPLFNIPDAYQVIRRIDRNQVERYYAEYYRHGTGGWSTEVSYRPIAESKAGSYPEARAGLMLEKALFTAQQDNIAIPYNAARDVTEIYGRALYEVIRSEDQPVP